VLTGLEFNKDGPTKKSSAHLLGVDLHAPISPRLDLFETIQRIHAQGGLAVAAHPHVMKSEWTKDTLYLWDHQEKFAAVIDAWEIANRNNLFMPVSLRRLPFLANSDFHNPSTSSHGKRCCIARRRRKQSRNVSAATNKFRSRSIAGRERGRRPQSSPRRWSKRASPSDSVPQEQNGGR